MSPKITSFETFRERQKLRWAIQALNEFGIPGSDETNALLLAAIERGEIVVPPPPELDTNLPD